MQKLLATYLDGKPLATSSRILIQVMSEDRPTGQVTVPAPKNQIKITDIGHDPWTIKPVTGTLTLARPEAATLQFQPLDPNGTATGNASKGPTLDLRPEILYYLVSQPEGR